MANSLYIAGTEARSGKSAICLGIMEILLRSVDRVAFFRPIIDVSPSNNNSIDDHINLITKHYQLETPYNTTYAYTAKEALKLLSRGHHAKLVEGVLEKYNALQKTYDFVLCDGYEFDGAEASFDFDINTEICNNLASPVVLVANAYNHAFEEVVNSINVYQAAFDKKGCEVIATIVNRIKPNDKDVILNLLKKEHPTNDNLIYTIPNEEMMGNPTVKEIANLFDADIISGEEMLNRHVPSFTIAAMEPRNLLTRIEYGTLVITPGDRTDVILTCLAAVASKTMPNISGIMLTGGLLPSQPVQRVMDGLKSKIPIISVKENTFPAARIVDTVHAILSPDNKRKITMAISNFEKNIDVDTLEHKIIKTQTTIITPKMFEYSILQKARDNKKHIVLPEGEDERILQASEILTQRGIVDITLLGNKDRINEKISSLGLHLDNANIFEPIAMPYFNEYVQTYYELRKKKAITMEMAQDCMDDWNFFGTMMLYKGVVDGMVSGAAHTTSDTIRPALQFIKTKSGCTIVSSVFLMCMHDRILVYGDCAVNPNPNAAQLADIAISSALTARTFNIEPRVALLSYSTGTSGKGEDVEKVREATEIARKNSSQYPDLKFEGPIQFDAAVDLKVAKMKMPDSEVAGRANVLIFPDLNTGNNTYKAVQRSSGAVAIGPILQGLNKPVNDLSRGCTVADIVNTVAITALQAQATI